MKAEINHLPTGVNWPGVALVTGYFALLLITFMAFADPIALFMGEPGIARKLLRTGQAVGNGR